LRGLSWISFFFLRDYLGYLDFSQDYLGFVGEGSLRFLGFLAGLSWVCLMGFSGISGISRRITLEWQKIRKSEKTASAHHSDHTSLFLPMARN
jgi:hypothetical protein